MRKLLFSAILIVSTASMAFAQSTDYNKVEFYGGYSHNRVDTGIGDNDPDLSDIVSEREGFHGFNTSITGNVTRYVGLKFDLAGHFKSKTFPIGVASLDVDSSVFNFLGGVQLKDNSKETRFKPFAHALIGAARVRNKGEFSNNVCAAVFPSPCPTNFTDTDTGLAGAIGGGLDIRASERIDVRAVQFDYNPTRVFDATQHNFRIGVGIVIH
jgi:opacity protein-like surface antigen